MIALPRSRAPRCRRHGLLAVALLLACSWRPLYAQEQIALELKLRIEQLRERGTLVLAGATVRNSPELAAVYEDRSFVPAWLTPATAAALDRAIRDVPADGLDPADYHLTAIETLSRRETDAARAAELDLLRTDALIRLRRHLRYGKATSDFPATGPSGSASASADEVRRVVESGRIAEELARMRPDHFTYRGLARMLAALRRIAEDGGWTRLEAGPALRPGDTGPRVTALRQRLRREDDHAPATAAADSVFDGALERALNAFQHRHALNEDGVLGPLTLAELNVSVETRIDQVRVNLERARWITHDLPDTFVAVNIAGAMVYFVRGGAVVFESRAVVGRTYTRTPIFRAMMQYIDLNPTWTVPPGIVHEIQAEVRRDRDYLRRMGMRVLDSSGRTVNLAAGTIAGMSSHGFPYVFRQEPGPLNPLGQIKFVFPNRYNVYLHDTPAKTLFDRADRTFSHGCIRVQNPLVLAELILNDPARWNRAAILAAVDAGTTRTIQLATPLPVLILYWTASADLHGELHFYRDAYGRDDAVLRALNKRAS